MNRPTLAYSVFATIFTLLCGGSKYLSIFILCLIVRNIKAIFMLIKK